MIFYDEYGQPRPPRRLEKLAARCAEQEASKEEQRRAWEYEQHQRDAAEAKQLIERLRAVRGGSPPKEPRSQLRPIKSRTFPHHDLLLELLMAAEALQQKVNRLTTLGHIHQDGISPYEKERGQIQLAWKEFQSAGGITSDDLRRWLAGQDIGPAPIRQKKHLRLVVDNKMAKAKVTSQFVYRGPSGDPPTAA